MRIAAVASGAVARGVVVTLSAQSWTSVPREGACFYEDADYRGDFFCVRAGESLDSLPSGVNDRISSIRIFGRAEVTVYRDDGLRGRLGRDSTTTSETCGRRTGTTGSPPIRVRRIASSAAATSGGSGDRPSRIVRRAYEDILDREPDSAGLRLYRSRIIDDGWTRGAGSRGAAERSTESTARRTRSTRGKGGGHRPPRLSKRAQEGAGLGQPGLRRPRACATSGRRGTSSASSERARSTATRPASRSQRGEELDELEELLDDPPLDELLLDEPELEELELDDVLLVDELGLGEELDVEEEVDDVAPVGLSPPQPARGPARGWLRPRAGSGNRVSWSFRRPSSCVPFSRPPSRHPRFRV